MTTNVMTKRDNRIKETRGSKIFSAINAFLLIFLCVLTLYPMWYCLVASFTSAICPPIRESW